MPACEALGSAGAHGLLCRFFRFAFDAFKLHKTLSDTIENRPGAGLEMISIEADEADDSLSYSFSYGALQEGKNQRMRARKGCQDRKGGCGPPKKRGWDPTHG